MSHPRGGNGARFVARPIAAGGTPLRTWLDWGRRFGELDLDSCPGLVVVAPHPDDETLGLGATAATLRSRGVDVRVVAVTDGGAAHPTPSAAERTELMELRRAELRAAAEVLGLGEPTFLGFDDGDVAAREDELAAYLADLLRGATLVPWCATTWRGDGHPDHEAAGRAAVRAAADVGTVALEYPVWMWHWATPDDEDVPWERLVTGPLGDLARRRKQRAVEVYATQFAATGDGDEVLPPYVVERLLALGEVVFR